MQERLILWGQLGLCFTVAVMSGCQHQSAASLRQHAQGDEEGFRLLWEANAQRCKEAEAEGAVYFSACRRFEMQTPLYNQHDKPRSVELNLRFNCEAQGELQLEVALAKSPVAVSMQGDRPTITNAWQQQSIKRQAGVADQKVRLEIPAHEKAMFVAMLDPFTAQSVKAGCRISYRLDLGKKP